MIGQEFRGRTGAGNPAGAGRRRFRPGRRRSAIRLPSRPGWLRQPPAWWRGQDGDQPGALIRLSSPDGPGPASPFGGPARPGCAGGSGGRARRLPGRSGRPRGWPSTRPGSPFLITEFAALWAAPLLSSAGDQLVQIAVAAGV